MHRSICAALAIGFVGWLSSVAGADLIRVQGAPGFSTEGLGNFAGTIQYDYQSGNTGHLAISLTNTTDPVIGGYITGFLFNIGTPEPNGVDTAALLYSSYPTVVNIPGPAINGAPFGQFDAGVGIGAQFEGGGNPTTGIGIGASGLFEFQVVSEYADVLSASSFIDGPSDFNFVVRFRGLSNGGSDKVPVPVPGSVALMGMGAIAIGSRRPRYH